ncbi:MAG: hypothetical protein KBS62_00265 [Oscillospiraceae bacterium]|nr:hypothetical protein [Candidatus Ruminococcus equi]
MSKYEDFKNNAIEKYEFLNNGIDFNEDGSFSAYIETMVQTVSSQSEECVFNEIIKIAQESGTSELILINKEKIIEILQKQIPKKPIYKLKACENEYYDCPTCHQYLWSDFKQRRCQHCGQALDWSDEK